MQSVFSFVSSDYMEIKDDIDKLIKGGYTVHSMSMTTSGDNNEINYHVLVIAENYNESGVH